MASIKINRVGIEGFRRLNDIDIEMRSMMALIGANGVGKTSFLDALSLLAASARGSLSQYLSDLGGFAAVMSRGHSEGITLRTEAEILDEWRLIYSLKVSPEGIGYSISQEKLTETKLPDDLNYIDSQGGNARYHDSVMDELSQLHWQYNPQESALSQMPAKLPGPGIFRYILETATQYHALDVSRMAPVKLPQQLRPITLPGQNGEDLAPFLYNLRETDHNRFEAVEDALKAAFPGFESLGFPPVAAGMIAMTWKDKAFNAPFYMNQLSEGTLRFLWLVSLLQSPYLPTITMIDEPEVSLHPELLSLFAELLREASLRSHIVVATHSDRLVRFLEPREVVIMDVNEDGGASMTWGDELDLDDWLTEYSLDEVWQMGIMGGRA